LPAGTAAADQPSCRGGPGQSRTRGSRESALDGGRQPRSSSSRSSSTRARRCDRSWPIGVRATSGTRASALWVADLDATVERLRSLGTAPLTAPVGAAGARRVCVLDPDGIVVELMEVPRPDPPTRRRAPGPRRRAAARRHHGLGRRHRRGPALLRRRDRPGAGDRFRAAHRRARGRCGCCREHGANRSLLAGGDLWLELRPVHRSGRPSASRRSPHQRPRHPQHRWWPAAPWSAYEALRDRVVAGG